MKRPQLIELLQRIRKVQADVRLIIAGSQALYGTTATALNIVAVSMEADLLLVREAFQARAAIEHDFGMDSPFQAEAGFYAHPVGLGTITLPSGWEERLVRFGETDGLSNVWTLEIHDLTVSKLMAGRDKDFEFLRVLLERGWLDFPALLERLQSLRDTVFANALPDRLAILARHLRDWKRDDLVRQLESLSRP